MTSHTFKPDLPAPSTNIGVLGWMRANLFSSWINTLLTLVGLYLIWLIVPPLIDWAIIKADWTGDTRADCTREGACWVFVQTRFSQFMYGFYPPELRWRVDATAWLAIIGAAPWITIPVTLKGGWIALYDILIRSLYDGTAILLQFQRSCV